MHSAVEIIQNIAAVLIDQHRFRTLQYRSGIRSFIGPCRLFRLYRNIPAHQETYSQTYRNYPSEHTPYYTEIQNAG